MVLRKTNPTRRLIVKAFESFIKQHKDTKNAQFLTHVLSYLRSSNSHICSMAKLQQIDGTQTLLVLGKILYSPMLFSRQHTIFCFEISKKARISLERSNISVMQFDHTLDDSQIHQLLLAHPRLVI